MKLPELEESLNRLDEMVQDGFVEISENGVRLPEGAHPFVRNV